MDDCKLAKINDSKTEFLFNTSPYIKTLAGIGIELIGQDTIKPLTFCGNLGAMFDINLQMDCHTSSVRIATPFHFRILGAIRSHLTELATAIACLFASHVPVDY